MQSIETVVEVNQKGIMTLTLPPTIAPGKHRIVLVIDNEISHDATVPLDDAPTLMRMAGQVTAFNTIKDPVAWQQQQRNEWDRDWER